MKSHRGVHFRVWATQQLCDYLVKGFVLNDEKFKQGRASNYFDQLLARIRDIRSSEKEFWRKVLEIYATSIDYDSRAEASQTFFATIQNKMHWAAHGHTAAEIIRDRADGTRPHAGSITSEAARTLAEQEYDKHRRSLDTQPSPVEVHFEEAVMKAKQLAEPGKKTRGEK